MLKYGLELPNGGACADPRLLAALAKTAEGAGWDGVFLEDYIVYSKQRHCPTADVWVALAAMAVATTRVRLGTAVTAVARRRPWKLAREVVTLDHLSGGRAVLGVGLGDPEDDGFRRVSEVHDLRLRAARLDEALEIVTGLWRGDEISFHGAHFRLDNVRFLPTSAQPDGIPIWVGGGWPGPAVRRAARYHGFMPYPRHPANPHQDADDPIPPADVAAMMARVESLRDNLDGFDIVIGGRRRRADWEAERDHIAAVAGAGATWWCEWVPPGSADEMRAAAGREPLRSR